MAGRSAWRHGMLLVLAVVVGATAVPITHARTARRHRVDPLERVDREHALRPRQGPARLVEVPRDLGVADRRLDPLALAYFADMSDEVWRRFGRRLIVASGYRSHAEQRRLFRRYQRQGVRRGLDRRQARRLANTYSARAGHSEHQLGTTVDIRDRAQNHLLEGPDRDPELQRWLRQNAHRYGFVNSYPANRRDPNGKPYDSATYKTTGYIVEPWHWRFVGKRAARLHHRLEARDGRRITTHEFVEYVNARPRLRRKLARRHPDDRRALRRLRRRLRNDRSRAHSALRAPDRGGAAAVLASADASARRRER